MSSENPPNVRRIQPYPIPADILKSEGQPPFKAEMVKLTDFGFLAKVETDNFYKVGENYQVSFLLPLQNQIIRSSAKVVKTYDSMENFKKDEKLKSYTIEMHFTSLGDAAKKEIQKFLIKIGQPK